MNEQMQTNQAKQHFNHCKQLQETLLPTIQRAAAIADLLEVAITVDGGDALNAGSIRNAAAAIQLELTDAKVMLGEFLNSLDTVVGEGGES